MTKYYTSNKWQNITLVINDKNYITLVINDKIVH